MTIASLEHLVAAGGARVVLVDNGSVQPLTDVDLAHLPGVEVVRSSRNLGFGGGVNLALDHLGVGRPGRPPRADAPTHIALVNNDAFVEPGWLDPLVRALEADPAVGAASSKLVFEPEFVPVVVESTLVAQRRGPALGAAVSGPTGTVFGPGFVAVRPGDWRAVAERAVVFVPLAAGDATVGDATAGDAVVGDAAPIDAAGSLRVDGAGGGVSIGAPGARCSVVQNAGNELTDGLWVRDRGAREPDDGRYDAAADVWGWCGGAVLLRGAYLADVGWFDERLFLYWEDVDLSWRGARRGWRYRYVPDSVVRHRHGASMGDRSARFEYLNQRNRLVVLARHAGLARAGRAWARQVAEIAWFAGRDVLGAPARGERPNGHRVAVRARALARAVALLARRPDPAASPGSQVAGRSGRWGHEWRPADRARPEP